MSTIAFDVDVAEGETAVDTATIAHPGNTPMKGVVTGVLIGFKDQGETPLVLHPGWSDPSALAATSIVDLQGCHIGRQVVLMFENGDPRRPVIIGLLRLPRSQPLSRQPGHIEIDADGQQLVVTAREQLVLRCGSASITLTKAGKVLIKGTYVSSHAAGVNRIKGGSVQLN